MEIRKNKNESTLCFELEGRLDTTTAPVFENELRESIDGINELIFDFAKLEYISSAGLRVILLAQKKMKDQGTLVLRNVCEDIREVFDITGFSDILTIE